MRRWTSPAITVTFFAAIAAVTVVLVAPTFRSIVRLNAETAAAHEQLERRYRSDLARGRAQRELAALAQTVSTLRDRIPTDDDALAFVRSIEDIAAARQLEVRIAVDWSAVDATDGRRVTGTPITVEFSGPYPSLVAAFRDIERLPLPLAAIRLTISVGTTDDTLAPTPTAKLVLQSRTPWRTAP